jgi:hypothetical protein
MKAAPFLAALALAVAVLSGCAMFQHLDGSTTEEMRAFEAGQPLQAEAQPPAISPEIQRNQAQLARELELVKREMELQKQRGAYLEEKTQKIERTVGEVASRAPEAAVPAMPIGGLRIKVLSGTGRLSSAHALRDSLVKFGYRVERVDMAPRSNFTESIVYYLAGLRPQAEELAARMGGRASVKPLSWKSVFDMIVVKGTL